MVSFLLVLLMYANGATIVEYRPSYDYGQVFHDFSEQTLSAVNGDSSIDAINDILYTDRGAYFNGNSDKMKLPPNNNVTSSFTIPSTFSINIWLMSLASDGLIFHRFGSANNYFYFSRNTDKTLQLHVLTATINTIQVSSYAIFLESNP